MLKNIVALLIILLAASACIGQSLPPAEKTEVLPSTTPPSNPEPAPTDISLSQATPTLIAIEVTAIFHETPTPTNSAPVNPNDICGNPFFPVVNGATWQYETIGVSQFTHTLTAGLDGSFTIEVKDGSDTFLIEGICTQDGIIIMDQGSSTAYSGEDGSSTVVSHYDEGITLPDDIQVGDDWSQTMSMEATSGETSFTAQLVTSYKALGYETITVPAGTFYALKIEQSGSMVMGGHEILTQGILWYAEGVGNVKAQNGLSGEAVNSIVLLSYNIPSQ